MATKRYVHGLITTESLGLTSGGITKRLRSGTLYRRYRGVYSMLPELTREGEWLAAVLAAGDGAALASLNAAVLNDVSRFKPTGITVAVPTRRRGHGFKLIVGLDPRDVRTRNHIPVTSVERTLIDVTDILQPEQIANMIHEAAFRKRFSAGATRRVMARSTRLRMSRLDKAIEMHLAGSAGTRSNLEDRFMALVREARLPEPVINTHIHGIEVDFRWGDYCVEIDGPHHLRPATSAKDQANEATLKAHGLTIVRFTEAAIDLEPRAVLRELAAQKLARRVARK
jgi:very-short-patch-repair endonuclease